MATCYFTLEKPARTGMGRTIPPGNYYIEGMDGFTSSEEVFQVALNKSHKEKVSAMWLQYNNKSVVDLFSRSEIYGDELSDFAQVKLTARKWGDQSYPLNFPYGSARYLNNGSGIAKKASS